MVPGQGSVRRPVRRALYNRHGLICQPPAAHEIPDSPSGAGAGVIADRAARDRSPATCRRATGFSLAIKRHRVCYDPGLRAT